ncbi:hypothetical protein [Streptosporangium sp. CA-115845]|uniref:hypothetical protein n=1 Tax=Streptosporangium sp. CA-115845 TaxID=3240071 RepID=UPI003D901175
MPEWPTLPPIPSWVPDVVAAITIGLGVIAVLLTSWGVFKGAAALARKAKASTTKPTGADLLTWLAATIATIVSAQGMWQFLDRIIGDVHWSLRALMFAFIEVAVVISAVRARKNMRENFSAGIDGIAVWALTGLSAVLSAMEASSLPEAVFRLAAPLVAAWLWERGMAIERHRATGRKRIHWRLTPERILVRLGLAESRDRTAEEVDAQRRLTRVALAAKRARMLRETGASERKMRAALTKLDRAFERAAEHAGLARDPQVQERLRSETGALYSTSGLLDVVPASEWMPAVKEAPNDFARLANETQQLNESLAVRDELRAIEANVSMLANHVTSTMTRPGVINPVNSGINDLVMIVPPEWTGEAPAVTSDVTADVTRPGVTEVVNFDINNPAIFDLGWPPPALTDMTPELTPDVTPGSVNAEVNDQRKADVMRGHWEQERAEGRYPRVVDLAREAGADVGQASRLRAELVAALPWREKRKANAKKAVNGSKPSS